MKIGDIVVRKSYGGDITFKIMDVVIRDNKDVFLLKGINLRIEADSTSDDLQLVSEDVIYEIDRVFNKKVNESIKKILINRVKGTRGDKSETIDFKGKIKELQSKKEKYKDYKNKNMAFGRPGKILHVDGDSEYLEVCLKTYKQLSLDAVGRVISEKDQANEIVNLVKEVKPDIVVITGHDGMVKGITDYMNLDNYRNSKYFVETVIALRSYNSNYDDLVIFAGACQSCYEAILDAGANFASAPNRVLIHCLDPVLVSEKIAYTNIETVVAIEDVIENTITGLAGIGGLQTRGKYREGFPKSQYI
ncbi:sporulation peptidase YabG [Clostridium estertheticum]|uniref:Sporulation peptidase YabG n=1 Tax=Clostridium estertheticum TaxID=238834 RepID=A0AA47EG41_9CLOT|nr:sporulation peptidase YabG [Clostridium estertheticum]MBU3157402.1 sporulation peptidase YabG [Clostridium estertheticum]MBU3200102.1 sporulation peptidase YabG [Clostridium estertheticum]WAG59566.1 sporulation peptidase YabG [Clostridium estertheticum]WAG66358.1 sporulation peptidase YabG [Clostridium estertheticum]